jgi:hypothetical protein
MNLSETGRYLLNDFSGGHGFSRADKAPNPWALAPEDMGQFHQSIKEPTTRFSGDGSASDLATNRALGCRCDLNSHCELSKLRNRHLFAIIE